MSIAVADVIQLLILVAIVVGAFIAQSHRSDGKVEALRGELDETIAEIRKENHERVRDLHQRIDTFRQEYLRREDFNAHMTGLAASNRDIAQDLRGLSRRMDSLFQILSRRGALNEEET
jgi:hypothetical protein